jgi:hypothetical protein
MGFVNGCWMIGSMVVAKVAFFLGLSPAAKWSCRLQMEPN